MADKRDSPDLRLAKVLREKKREVGSYSELARIIKEANREHRGRHVDRRKLRRIVEGEDVSLTLVELRALDTFLTPFGEGLADRPLFDRPNPILSLVENGTVTMVLGAYPRPDAQRNDLSRWDVRSMAHLVRNIALRKPGTDVEIEDLLVEEEHRAPSYLKNPGRSLCSIGSPRACSATEWLLARMFGVEAFDEQQSPHVPLHFLWSPAIGLPYPSAFSPRPDNLPDLDSELRDKLNEDRVRAVLEVNGVLYEDSSPRDPGQATGRSYGVVLAQQRAEGDVWMVVAGLTGPATFACASAVAAGLTGAVPESRDGHSRIRWDVVAATVARTGALQGDPREVKSVVVVDYGLAEKLGRRSRREPAPRAAQDRSQSGHTQ
jgi:hypothetical protein